MTHTLKLENLLNRRRITVHRFLESENIATKTELDVWLSSQSSYEISDILLEQMYSFVASLGGATPPTPSKNKKIEEVVPVKSEQFEVSNKDHVPFEVDASTMPAEVGQEDAVAGEQKTARPKKQK